ncbi:transporter associated domain-containing protein [Psychrobacter sp.]|uniref:TerC family protein n=1 Tax=Psychrobacter sp. TaxID=56811 RepID=UPI0025DDC64F|nr:transporter associated domain-containing protein [Psychrobacter sp.]
MIELLADPSVWLGFFTLFILELVLGIDNLVFIAILANKLPPHLRDKARNLGLTLALVMRLGLLYVMSWLITLTNPIAIFGSLDISIRDLILIVGGVFLLFKATAELHEHIEGKPEHKDGELLYASFTAVVVQIVTLDAVFSFDAVITAVGMVKHLEVMMAAVIAAMAVMILASKPLTNFVGKHPTVIILCLSFLLMIGFSLIVEGFGLHLPKGYLYAAIGFSILIEAFNQFAKRNRTNYENRVPLRERTADNILRLMGGKTGSSDELAADNHSDQIQTAFEQEERYMMSGVLALGERDIETVMTPRSEISWVNIHDSVTDIKVQVFGTPHSLLPICDNSIDTVLGVVRSKSILQTLESVTDDDKQALYELAKQHQPVYVSDVIDNLHLIKVLKKAKGNLAIVIDEFGQLAGLVTPLDLFEAIAGEFPDEDESPDINQHDGFLIVEGTASLDQLRLELGDPDLYADAEQLTIGGYLGAKSHTIPKINEVIEDAGYRYTILETQANRIVLIRIEPIE